jgi:hypothetical protein
MEIHTVWSLIGKEKTKGKGKGKGKNKKICKMKSVQFSKSNKVGK